MDSQSYATSKKITLAHTGPSTEDRGPTTIKRYRNGAAQPPGLGTEQSDGDTVKAPAAAAGSPANAMTASDYLVLKKRIGEAGYAKDIEWSESVRAPISADALACEAIFVICNSGMKNTIAREIYDRVRAALLAGRSASTAFGHAGKAVAIDMIWLDREHLLAEFRAAPDPVAWCRGLPWIGDITCWHLAKNLGVDCAKPDRWLVRVAATSGETVEGLCRRLSETTGDRIATVDVVIWRACTLGFWKESVAT